LKPVGIIANPASGKDIRRLVAYGSVFDNNEKVNSPALSNLFGVSNSNNGGGSKWR
jgi:predicted polyphosphate/ATP-dependent NAD kinase